MEPFKVYTRVIAEDLNAYICPLEIAQRLTPLTMDDLDQTLGAIESAYADNIKGTSRIYIEVDIGAQAQKLGYSEAARKYRKVLAVVPVNKAGHGMRVRIDGRTFVNYGQLPSGLIVPGHVFQQSKRPFKTYVPHDSMILNVT